MHPARVVIDRGVWVGANVTVLPEVTIGDGAVVGGRGGRHEGRACGGSGRRRAGEAGGYGAGGVIPGTGAATSALLFWKCHC